MFFTPHPNSKRADIVASICPALPVVHSQPENDRHEEEYGCNAESIDEPIRIVSRTRYSRSNLHEWATEGDADRVDAKDGPHGILEADSRVDERIEQRDWTAADEIEEEMTQDERDDERRIPELPAPPSLDREHSQTDRPEGDDRVKQPRLAEEFVEIGEQTEPAQGEMRDRREQLASQHVRSS